ncbi:MAG: ribosome biogenesis GTP-binding protein YihA/YsxC [Bacteroidales bacterium]|jgi:GTP-binding protein|nr:ribosome biogenesis GTP-binding protein YihA/YsxC [Bacteroidales bacterium]
MIKQAEFVISSSNYTGCPSINVPEFAFIGRSNVGKSSLLNTLTGIKGLAKTSSKPGKTRLINHFSINKGKWFMVDLPGYGYATISKTEQQQFKKMTADYLLKRENLISVFVLVDTRLSPQQIDLDFMQWLGRNNVPFAIVGTKADKSKINIVKKNISALVREMRKTWDELPPVFITSSTSKLGIDELLGYIENIVDDVSKN